MANLLLASRGVRAAQSGNIAYSPVLSERLRRVRVGRRGGGVDVWFRSGAPSSKSGITHEGM